MIRPLLSSPQRIYGQRYRLDMVSHLACESVRLAILTQTSGYPSQIYRSRRTNVLRCSRLTPFGRVLCLSGCMSKKGTKTSSLIVRDDAHQAVAWEVSMSSLSLKNAAYQPISKRL